MRYKGSELLYGARARYVWADNSFDVRLELAKRLDRYGDIPEVLGYVRRIRESSHYRTPGANRRPDEPTTEDMRQRLRIAEVDYGVR